MEYNSDFQYDLKFGNKAETEFAEIVKDSTVEIKSDRKTIETGNIYIEYKSRGKQSGLATTKAKTWVYKIQEGCMIVIDTELLKKTLRYLIKSRLAVDKVRGGDNNTSLGILVNIERLIENLRIVEKQSI